MASSDLRRFDPNLRQQLAAMLSGDAKAGSVRAQLVKGLIGSSTGEDSGLVGMTPLGAAFDVDAMNRDKRIGPAMGHALGAVGAMIPGAGGAAERALEPAAAAAIKHLAENFHPADLAGDIVDKAYESGGLSDLIKKVGVDPATSHLSVGNPGAISDALIKKFSPTELATMHHEMQAHLGPDAIASPDTVRLSDEDPSEETLKNARAQSSVRAQLEAASKDGDVVTGKSAPTVFGTGDALSKATKPQPVKISDDPESMDIIHEAAGGDPKKLNFIKNAMMDEGGNLPEDVAMTLIDHMNSRIEDGLADRDQVKQLADLKDWHGEDDQDLIKGLVKEHSIPEMLAMHYDLDPETLGKAYKMPSTAGSRSRPTQ